MIRTIVLALVLTLAAGVADATPRHHHHPCPKGAPYCGSKNLKDLHHDIRGLHPH
jgi:hypothetical protein